MIEIVDGGDEREKTFQAFADRVFYSAVESIEYVTAPLAHFKDGLVCEIRTGIFIQIDQMRFLVTAAHGLIEHNDEDRPLHIVMPERGLDPVPLVREKFWSTINDNEDLAVTRLSDQTVKELGDHFRFLRLTDMMSKHDRRHEGAHYLLMGYPLALFGPDETGTKRCGPWKYLTSQYIGDCGNVTNYVPAIHVILDYNRRARSEKGVTVHPPGLSGCGIWFVGDPLSHVLFKPDDFKLVGIQTSWHKGFDYAKGTWTDNVLQILWKYFSDTRAPMRLHGISF